MDSRGDSQARSQVVARDPADLRFTQDPADLRFTQDSIGLYFRRPYRHVNVREVVKKLFKNEMGPDEFPPIRVISYDGLLWSIDNRRLWVFRWARCPNIKVEVMTESHHRLEKLKANARMYSTQKVQNFFPFVRARGDPDFDLYFPRPVYPTVQQVAPSPRSVNVTEPRGKEQQHAPRNTQARIGNGRTQWVPKVDPGRWTEPRVQDLGTQERQQHLVPICSLESTTLTTPQLIGHVKEDQVKDKYPQSRSSVPIHSLESESTLTEMPLNGHANEDQVKDEYLQSRSSVPIPYLQSKSTLNKPLLEANKDQVKDEYPQPQRSASRRSGWNFFSSLWKISVSIRKKIASIPHKIFSGARDTAFTICRGIARILTGIRNYCV